VGWSGNGGQRSRPTIISSDTPRSGSITPRDSGPSPQVLQAAQDVSDHLARMASRVSDLFDEFDVDKNGLIDKREWRAACVSLGITYPPNMLDQVFDLLDEDGSGQLEHNEVVRKARKAAFERGFVPRRVPQPPAPQRRLDAYWERRNRLHVEQHEEAVSRRVQQEEEERQQAIDRRREEALLTLRSKRHHAHEKAIGRQELTALRRLREERRERKVQQALEETMRQPVLFLPALPEAKAIAKATWAKDPTAPRRQIDREESIREVSSLQDVWVGSLIQKWQVPTMEQKAKEKLRGISDRGKGRAPKSSAFRNLAAPTLA